MILIDSLCAEYSWSLDYVMGWRVATGDIDAGLSLAQASMLMTAIALKNGRSLAEPSYQEREILKAIQQ